MYMIFKLQTHPEPTQTRKPAYLNLDSPPYHRRAIVWSPLLFGIFPLSVSGSPNMKNIIPDSPTDYKSLSSSDLSSIPSETEDDFDFLDDQSLAPPKEGNSISSNCWTPIATSSTSGARKQKKRKSRREAEPPRFPEWTPEISTYLSKKKPNRKPKTKKKTATTARSKKEKAPRQTPRQNSPGTSPLFLFTLSYLYQSPLRS
ncbi:hypothetical protein PGT21_010662 [Puccinia graminis f. sp. tritici]|uniref:Uncharacterized protein n=1 Tax=Puccinia graminis f. sp. tritici TaxID=56615 RepID=A0A5B0N8A8_PUCGR|nr:hypothetical protein PGT21_010662 [Puccinia graminis f. sp. tritici]